MSTALEREHADTIGQLRTLADVIPAHVVASAFVTSLASRDLEARSALGSYAFARVVPDTRPSKWRRSRITSPNVGVMAASGIWIHRT